MISFVFIVATTSFIAFLIKLYLCDPEVFQKYISKLKNVSSRKCTNCKCERSQNDIKWPELIQNNHNYQLQIRYEDNEIMKNGVRTNGQNYYERNNRLVSFCGSVAIQYPIGEGNKNSNRINLKMMEFAKEIIKMKNSNPPVFDDWYHRYSGSIVLAICQWKDVSKPDAGEDDDCDNFVYTKGINVEVSLATGSICAERVAIAEAHTNHPSLIGHKNLISVAVLEVSAASEKTRERNPLFPCGMCQIWLEKVASSEIRIIAYPNTDFTHFIEVCRPWSI